eukprot:548322-Rhodomonas_salina.6
MLIRRREVAMTNLVLDTMACNKETTILKELLRLREHCLLSAPLTSGSPGHGAEDDSTRQPTDPARGVGGAPDHL